MLFFLPEKYCDICRGVYLKMSLPIHVALWNSFEVEIAGKENDKLARRGGKKTIILFVVRREMWHYFEIAATKENVLERTCCIVFPPWKKYSGFLSHKIFECAPKFYIQFVGRNVNKNFCRPCWKFTLDDASRPVQA